MDTLRLGIEQGRLPKEGVITTKMLHDSGLIGKVKHGVKLLGRGAADFKERVTLHITESSAMAQAAIEAHGGSIEYVYYNRLGLRAHLKPHKFDLLPKLARPPRKWAQKHGITNHL